MEEGEEEEAVLEDHWRAQLELKGATELWPALRAVVRSWPVPSCRQ